MLGILWFLFWQAAGVVLAAAAFRDKRRSVQLWLGSVLGSVLSMWAPIPFSFLLDFTIASHLTALGLGLILAGLAMWYLRKSPIRELVPEESTVGDKPLLWLLPPFFLVCAVMVYNHTLLPVGDAMYTGQCTYGDMSMHLGFISSIAEQGTFPPQYSIFPEGKLCYPFLCDSISSSLYLLGSSLRMAYIVPMLFAFAQCFAGFWFLAREICREKGAAVLAFILFFLNGGLGIVHFFGEEYSFRNIFTGFYETPTNLIEKQIRWVNVLVDMMLPQRATLFGWAALFAALYLLFRAVFRRDRRGFLPAGILGGLLPMIHTHSFFALGLTAFAWLVYSLIRDGFTRDFIRSWSAFGFTAVALAVPQLLIWTFQSVGGNESFLRLGFDWVNGGQENWLWFWLRNVGPIFVLTPLAFLFGETEERAIFSGAIFIYVLAELVLFQPNPYDNNKLLYIWYLFSCLLTADFVIRIVTKLHSRIGRGIALGLLLLVCTNAALLSLGREVISGTEKYGYELFNGDEVAASQWVKKNTESDALFLTCDNHDNAVAVLTGRNILCGSGSYLYYHGLNYGSVQQQARAMLTDAASFERYRQNFGIDYVWIGQYERALSGCIEAYLLENYPVAYAGNSIGIFDVRQ